MGEFTGGQEKCVDIALAVDMLHYATVPNAFDVAVLVSGDRDFIPALVRTRQKGKRVAVCSMRNSASTDYEDPAANIKDFGVLWLDDHLEELVAPIHPSLLNERPAMASYLRSVVIDFVMESSSGGSRRGGGRRACAAAYSEVLAHLGQVALGETSAQTYLEHEFGGLLPFLDLSPDVFGVEPPAADAAAAATGAPATPVQPPQRRRGPAELAAVGGAEGSADGDWVVVVLEPAAEAWRRDAVSARRGAAVAEEVAGSNSATRSVMEEAEAEAATSGPDSGLAEAVFAAEQFLPSPPPPQWEVAGDDDEGEAPASTQAMSTRAANLQPEGPPPTGQRPTSPPARAMSAQATSGGSVSGGVGDGGGVGGGGGGGVGSGGGDGVGGGGSGSGRKDGNRRDAGRSDGALIVDGSLLELLEADAFMLESNVQSSRRPAANGQRESGATAFAAGGGAAGSGLVAWDEMDRPLRLEDLAHLTVPQVKLELRARALPVAGTKPELLRRLLDELNREEILLQQRGGADQDMDIDMDESRAS